MTKEEKKRIKKVIKNIKKFTKAFDEGHKVQYMLKGVWCDETSVLGCLSSASMEIPQRIILNSRTYILM